MINPIVSKQISPFLWTRAVKDPFSPGPPAPASGTVMVHSGKKDSASASASGSMASGASGLSLSGSTWPGCTPKPDVDDYANQVLRQRLGTLLLQMGWQSAHNSSLNVLVDLAGRYLRDLGSHCQSQAELSNRSQANILDVARTLADFRIQTADLADYADCLPRGSGPTAGGIPDFPRPSVTQLNFLKPGSREVLHRKVYVNDYFPPMYPNLEEEEGEGSERDAATMDTDAPTPSGEIVGQVGGPGPESLPVREIASVMMTSAGFISPAREGKLPESRTPYVHEMVRERESEAHKVVQAEGKAHFKAKMKAKNAGSMDKKLKVFQKKAPKVQPHAHSPPKSVVSETSMNDHHIDDTINAVIQRGLKDSNKPKPLPESPPKRGRPPKRKASECVPEPRLDLSPGEIIEPEVETPPPPPPKPKKAKVPKSAANPPASATPASSKKTMSTPRKLAGVDDEPIKTPPTPEILREKEAMRKAKATNADTPTPPPSLPAKSPEPEKIRKKEKKKKTKKDKKESRGEKRDKSKKAEKREKGRDKTNKAITKLKIKDTSSVTGASPEPPPPIPPVSVSISVSNTPTTSKPTKKSKADSAKKIPELKLFLPTATIKKTPVEPIKTNITLPPAPPEPAKITVPVPPKKEKIVKRRKSTKAPPAPPSAPSSSVVAAASTPTPTPPSRSGPPTTKATAVDGNAGGSITTRTVGHYVDADGNQIWICPACGKQDDGSPMIGCDECDDWYHWLCVGIRSEPDESQNWFCQRCVARKRGPML